MKSILRLSRRRLVLAKLDDRHIVWFIEQKYKLSTLKLFQRSHFGHKAIESNEIFFKIKNLVQVSQVFQSPELKQTVVGLF